MRKRNFGLAVVITIFVICSMVFGTDRLVPSQYANIQAAINAAVSGDTVIVDPNTYYENINFWGNKRIILTSISPNNPAVVAATIIDGGGNGSVVTFSGYENEDCQLIGFTIKNGDAVYGGGVSGNFTEARVIKCVIKNNTADYGGGLYGVNGRINKCRIFGNLATENGGGIGGSGGDITNGLIYDNQAAYGGGLNNCNGDIVNCTVVDNAASIEGDGFRNCDGSITNCIIWGNGPDQLSGSAVPTYSCIQGWGGSSGGNINNDPDFADPTNDDYHLEYGSPCIDTGTNNAPYILYSDIEEIPRPFDGDSDGVSTYDMGAYEYIDVPVRRVEPGTIWFSAIEGGADPEPQSISIWNAGIDEINWEISESCDWLDVSPDSGSSTGEIDEVILSVDITGLDLGHYFCEVTISDPNAANSPQTVPVNLSVSCGCYTGPDIVEWCSVGMPVCWCYPKQCHGDADGQSELLGFGVPAPVTLDDVTIFIAAYRQLEGSANENLCADFDHAKEALGWGRYSRVASNDVAVLLEYYRNMEDNVPADCQMPNPVEP